MVPSPHPLRRLFLGAVSGFLLSSILVSACTVESSTSPASPESTISPSSAPTPDQTTADPERAHATVERVVDGDTLVIDFEGQRERVRLIGIDTPESVAENRPDQCYGVEASNRLTELLPAGTKIWITRDVEARDQYGRLLAYVYRTTDDLFVNLAMVEEGYAGVFTFPPNVTFADLFVEAAARAREADLGLWGACGGPDVDL
ncbi:MAG: thermonuclease family protein [Actinomycetia bacterium]|nr:thermonuclease family protein [Actinomycetes bacterium]